MRLIGYIAEIKSNSFAIPIYSGDDSLYYVHELDRNFKITDFSELSIKNNSNFIAVEYDISFRKKSVGAIVFIGDENNIFFGKANKIIKDIYRYINNKESSEYIKKEILYLKNIFTNKNIIKARYLDNKEELKEDNKLEKIQFAIDIGTSKIVAIVGKKTFDGKIEILGVGNCPSFGVQRGVVINIARTVDSIKKAVIDAERQSGIKFKKVHVGIAGQHIKSIQHRGILTRNNNDTWISYEDIQKLKNEMYKLALPPGDRILHVLPQEYIVDNERGIYNEPIGRSGVRLEGNFHIITGAETAIQNIEHCINIAGLEISSIELEPLASADAVLNKEELEGGVCLVDIGGGTTDIAIFENFVVRHTSVIPFGGNIITEDLRDFRILREQAEVLKVLYGSAIPFEELRNKHVSIQGESMGVIGSRDVNLLAVSKVISARMKEILAHVSYQISLSGYSKKLIGGIVLTGGGSLLKHLAQLTELETGQSTRLGLPKNQLALNNRLLECDSPIFSTSIGLLVRGFKQLDEENLIKENNIIYEIPKKNGEYSIQRI